MIDKNPADAVREAPTELERIIAEMREISPFADVYGAKAHEWADRLAALAGAAPVAEVMDVMGFPVIQWKGEDYPIGTKLFTHAPAKAREDGNYCQRCGYMTWNGAKCSCAEVRNG